ncbi:MAG: RagB/SusD family nutrient uptake outer membrane protein, partial [Odoribacter sp.]|nr:RagB/SusD family nutrient uptake outer membrane protein [Odoribacter sp.]
YKLVDSPNAPKKDNGKICILYEGDQITVPNYGGYKPHNYVYPVPQKERDLNPNLTQNPGY